MATPILIKILFVLVVLTGAALGIQHYCVVREKTQQAQAQREALHRKEQADTLKKLSIGNSAAAYQYHDR